MYDADGPIFQLEWHAKLMQWLAISALYDRSKFSACIGNTDILPWWSSANAWNAVQFRSLLRGFLHLGEHHLITHPKTTAQEAL